jgi:hypothetical protein
MVIITATVFKLLSFSFSSSLGNNAGNPAFSSSLWVCYAIPSPARCSISSWGPGSAAMYSPKSSVGDKDELVMSIPTGQ